MSTLRHFISEGVAACRRLLRWPKPPQPNVELYAGTKSVPLVLDWRELLRREETRQRPERSRN